MLNDKTEREHALPAWNSFELLAQGYFIVNEKPLILKKTTACVLSVIVN